MRFPRPVALILTAMLTLSAAGCSGFSGPYERGYLDGMSAGHAKAGHARFAYAQDGSAYRGDALYRTGWDSGYRDSASMYRREIAERQE
jgi:hypothetical protein